MFHIALCDDDARQIQLTHKLLDNYLSLRGVAAKIWEFSNGQALLNAMYDETFDLYLLDIVMPEMDGIDLGMELRKSDENGVIIYLTTSPDFALQGYQTKAASYLLKPVREVELFRALDDAVADHARRRENGILVKCHDGTVRLNADDIFFAELNNRSARYHLREGCVESTTITGPFKEAVAPLLRSKCFLLCGSSFIVNLHHIKMVDKTGALFADGHYLSLPRSACGPLRSAWTDYWLEGGMKP